MILLKKILEFIKSYWIIISVVTVIAGGITGLRANAVKKYVKEQSDRKLEQNVNKLIISDSVQTSTLYKIQNEVIGIRLDLRDIKKQQKVESDAIVTHMKNQKTWEELFKFQQDQINEVKKNNSEPISYINSSTPSSKLTVKLK